MPPILDVAIGTVFVFLLFSLVVSALNEVILSYLDQRAKFLQMGLKELLGKSDAAPKCGLGRLKDFVVNLVLPIFKWIKHIFVAPQAPAPDPSDRVQKLCSHGLISALSRSDKGNAPSYIPAGAFVTSLFDLLISGELNVSGAVQASATPVVLPDLSKGAIPEALRTAIANLPNGDRLKDSLSSLLAIAGQDLDQFKTAIEGWFNDAMDRVTGWYKRFAQKWMIMLGLVLAIILNVDTLRIVQTLSSNPNLAKAVAAQAESYAKTNSAPATNEEVTKTREEKEKLMAQAQKDLDDAKKTGDVQKVADAQRKLDDAIGADAAKAKFLANINALKTTGIPIGWDAAQLKDLGLEGKPITFSFVWGKRDRIEPWLSEHRGQVFLLIAGWFLTALAASLGAPFWFDMLGRFINIRNAGKAPDVRDPTASTTTPAPTSLNKTPGTPLAAPGVATAGAAV